MRSPIAKEGFPFIALFALATAGLTHYVASPIGAGVGWVLTLWCIWFFRDPERQAPQDENVVIAPADGVVVAIEEVEKAPLTGEPARKVSIFMNVFNVHVNRVPVAGTITALSYHPGKFVNAALDKASTENERQEVLIETEAGVKIPFVQVAGLIARRIVCKVVEGQKMERAERMGLIRFGSRVDVYLPLDAEVVSVLGDKTSAVETIIARLRS